LKSLRIADGDLQIVPGGAAAVVEGREKLVQDLAIWLMTPIGSSPLAPGFGSALPGMIGEADTDALTLSVESEVGRILGLYQANQLERLKASRDAGNLAVWNRSELLDEIVSVHASASDVAVYVTAVLNTASGQQIVLPTAVTDEGVSA
jgi:hypothetical protein